MVLVGDLTVSGKGASQVGGVNREDRLCHQALLGARFHQVLTTGQTGPWCLTEKEAESWVMWGSVPQSLKGHMGGDFVLGQPSLWLSQPVLHPVSGSRPLS